MWLQLMMLKWIKVLLIKALEFLEEDREGLSFAGDIQK